MIPFTNSHSITLLRFSARRMTSPWSMQDAVPAPSHSSSLAADTAFRAMDFSAAILEQARAAAAKQGYSERISFEQSDLTALSIPSGSVQRAVCWGVLMHVPDIGAAVAELARVIAPGGTLVVSEGNMRSLQAVTLRWLKKLLGRERAEIMRTPAGIEFWEETSTARLMTRQADIPWLIAEFRRHGLELVERRAGQFTEIYVLLPWKPLRSLVHAINNHWFRWIKFAGPAYGNLLIMRRPTPDS